MPDVIHAGDIIENPVTGMRVVFRKTAGDTGGHAVVVEAFLEPNGFLPILHVHPGQEERIEVLHGSVGACVGRHRAVVGPGARLTAPPGTAHRFWNAGDETAHLVAEISPALRLETLVETLFALAADGRTDARGRPSPLRLAVIAAAHFDTIRLPFPPPAVQRVALAIAAPAGRALGYRPVHVPTPQPVGLV